MIFANTLANAYAGEPFPGVADTASFFAMASNETEKMKWLDEVKSTVNDVIYSLANAKITLELYDFKLA